MLYVLVYSGLLPYEHESYYLQCWEFLHPGFHILHYIGFSIGMTTWYLIYYHISFEEKPYSLLTPGQTIWTGLVGKATPSKTAKLSLGRNIDFIQIINLHFLPLSTALLSCLHQKR